MLPSISHTLFQKFNSILLKLLSADGTFLLYKKEQKQCSRLFPSDSNAECSHCISAQSELRVPNIFTRCYDVWGWTNSCYSVEVSTVTAQVLCFLVDTVTRNIFLGMFFPSLFFLSFLPFSSIPFPLLLLFPLSQRGPLEIQLESVAVL